MAVNQQQLDYLNAMGIDVWISRDLPLPDLSIQQRYEVNLDSVESRFPAELSGEVALVTQASPVVVSDQADAATLSKKGLRTADELIKDLRQTPVKKIAELAANLDDTSVIKPQIVSQNLEGVDWIELEKTVSQCTACDLHEKRQQTVFGQGSQRASLMIVGDIPRLSDEQQNQPFTGEAGELLSNMLSHLGVNADTIYYANLLKCRTPLDSSPQSNQAASCSSYLKQQIKLLQPSLVLLMGRSTAQHVLGQDLPMVQLRQKIHKIEGIDSRLVASYHPAYLLKQPRLKALVWKDLQFTKQILTNNG